MNRAASIFRVIVWSLIGLLLGSLVLGVLVTSVASCSRTLTSPAMGVFNPPAGARPAPAVMVFLQASDTAFAFGAQAAGRRNNFPTHAA